jgi:GST-like protein
MAGHLLYGTRGSGAAIAELGLSKAGVAFEMRRASRWESDSAFDELLKVNPLGQIPTLVLPGGAVLTESAAILIHLGLEYPGSGLLPAEPGARAQALRGLVYIAANCYSMITVSDYPERFIDGGDEAAHKAVRSAARRQLHAAWDHFADQFPGTPFLGGVEPGALDMMAAVVSRWSGTRAHLKSSRPAFTKLLATIEAHPAIRPVLARHFDL